MVWIVVAAVVALSLVGLALALLRAYRAGRQLAREVGRAGEAVAAAELTVGAPPAPAPPTVEELRAREAALVEREAALVRREERLATGAPTPAAAHAAKRGRSWGAPA